MSTQRGRPVPNIPDSSRMPPPESLECDGSDLNSTCPDRASSPSFDDDGIYPLPSDSASETSQLNAIDAALVDNVAFFSRLQTQQTVAVTTTSVSQPSTVTTISQTSAAPSVSRTLDFLNCGRTAGPRLLATEEDYCSSRVPGRSTGWDNDTAAVGVVDRSRKSTRDVVNGTTANNGDFDNGDGPISSGGGSNSAEMDNQEEFDQVCELLRFYF